MAADLALAMPGGLVRVTGGPGAAPGRLIEAVVGEELDIHAVLGRFAPHCPAGIGPATAPEAVRVSLRQATGLLAVSRTSGAPAEARQSEAARLLLDLGDRRTLHGYADTVLGPLDLADGGEELIATLAAWLETGGAWDATSRRLGVHRHTVRNRLDKAMDLTGRRLDDPDDRFDLWLATRIRRGGAPPRRPLTAGRAAAAGRAPVIEGPGRGTPPRFQATLSLIPPHRLYC
ncbi:PucR family transcriptional regulator [Streptomyces noursei]|uniref:PucR family transcriptional regulator n=1 Tax=Streptomyces noursei TaxID=1971 RepID=UPI0022863C93|nr:helix-turn-helix domain-containing protein [Streptomyces noursei]